MSKESAQEAGTAPKTASCPRCQGAAKLLSPMKNVTAKHAAYGCGACGYAFNAAGHTVVENAEELKDVFRGGTLGGQTLSEMFKGERINPATQALFFAQLTEYGLQMWMDGLKQGLLLGAMQRQHEAQKAEKE